MNVSRIGQNHFGFQLRERDNAPSEAQLQARKAFQTTQGSLQDNIRELRREIANSDLSSEQRVQARRLFQSYAKEARQVASEFRRSDSTDATPYLADLITMAQDLYSAVGEIFGPDEPYAGPQTEGRPSGGSGSASLDLKA